jgi:hypothetical protein
MNDNESERIARLERRVDYLIRYLGIDPAHIASGVMPAGFPAGLPTGDGLPLSLDVCLDAACAGEATGPTPGSPGGTPHRVHLA